MRTIGTGALLALLALACAAKAQTVGDARAFVTGLYDAYAHSSPDYLGRGAPAVFSPRLLGLIRGDARKAHGEVGALDGDPICDCQDWDHLRILRLDVRSSGAGRATASLSLRNAGRTERMTLDLLSVQGNWRVDDVHTKDTPSLARYLATYTDY